MATARLTIGSVLGTVQVAANTMSSTINAAGKAIGMIDTYVSEAADKQAIRSKADMMTYVDQLITEKAEEEATRKVAIQDFCAKSPEHRRHYEVAYNRYFELLSPNIAQQDPQTEASPKLHAV